MTFRDCNSILILLLFSSVVFVDCLYASYSKGGKLTSERFLSPIIETDLQNILLNYTLFVPNDSSGCHSNSFVNASLKMVLLDDQNCEILKKIENACEASASGLIIQWQYTTAPGIDYRLGVHGINSKYCVDLITMEVVHQDGERLRYLSYTYKQVNITFTEGDTNLWKNAFESKSFLIIFRYGLSVLSFLVLVFQAYQLHKYFANEVWEVIRFFKMGNKPINAMLFNRCTWVYYIDIFSTLFLILTIAIDPLGYTGSLNRASFFVISCFAIVPTFIATSLVIVDYYMAAVRRLPKFKPDPFIGVALLAFVILTISCFVLDFVSSLMQAYFIIVYGFEWTVVTLRLFIPLFISMTCFIAHYKFRKIELMLSKSLNSLQAAIVLTSKCMFLLYIFLYMSWFWVYIIRLIQPIWYIVNGRITLAFFGYILLLPIKCVNALYARNYYGDPFDKEVNNVEWLCRDLGGEITYSFENTTYR